MLADEVTFKPSHQSKYVNFVETVQGGLTSTPYIFEGGNGATINALSQMHPEVKGVLTAGQEF